MTDQAGRTSGLPLTRETALEHVGGLFRPTQSHLVGVELELFPAAADNQSLVRLDSRLEAFGHGLDGRLSLEPGGQLELSSRPKPDIGSLVESVSHDLDRVQRRLGAEGSRLVAQREPDAPVPDRVLNTPRYNAMERYFAPWAPNGERMMRATVSLQVNIDVGTTPTEVESRWRLLYAIGPTLVATFANSPDSTAPSKWKSDRVRTWINLDDARTGVPPGVIGPESSSAYAEWALEAPLMLVRRDSDDWIAPPGISFADWIDHGSAVVPGRSRANLDDLEVHLSTLFPFVRPRRYFEVRYLDMPPSPCWIVPVAVIYALATNANLTAEALATCAGLENMWFEAAKDGLRIASLRRAANRLLHLAASGLRLENGTSTLARCVDSYRERWTSYGLCPADD